jgi:hypothetical protein
MPPVSVAAATLSCAMSRAEPRLPVVSAEGDEDDLMVLLRADDGA